MSRISAWHAHQLNSSFCIPCAGVLRAVCGGLGCKLRRGRCALEYEGCQHQRRLLPSPPFGRQRCAHQYVQVMSAGGQAGLACLLRLCSRSVSLTAVREVVQVIPRHRHSSAAATGTTCCCASCDASASGPGFGAQTLLAQVGRSCLSACALSDRERSQASSGSLSGV